MDNLPDKESKSKGSDQEAMVLWMTRQSGYKRSECKSFMDEDVNKRVMECYLRSEPSRSG